MKYKNLAYCIFKNTFNMGNILNYFIDTTENLWVYIYPSSNKNSPTIFKHYNNGELVEEKEVFFYKGTNKIIIMICYNLYYLYFFCHYKIKNAFIMVNYPPFFFFRHLLRLFGSNKTILRVGDYFPNKTGLIKVYSAILNYCIKHAKYLIFSSQKIFETYSEEVDLCDDQIIRVITLGIVDSEVPRNPKDRLLGFLGNLRGGQGLELTFDFLEKNSDFSLEVVGEGVLKEHYMKEVEDRGLGSQVKFLGFVSDEDLPDVLSRWQAALAPYDPSPDNLTYYTEPSKVKLYTQYELPIIMTRVTYMQNELIEYNAGYVIEDNVESMEKAVRSIVENYEKFEFGISALKKKYYYRDLYDAGYSFMAEENIQ